MNQTKMFLAGLFSLLSLSSCSLDKEYFEPRKTDSYKLDPDIIPTNRRELVHFESNGHRIYGVFVEGTAGEPNDIPTLIYFHGDDQDIDKFWPRVGVLDELGYNIFIFDYQGYGRSEGDPSLAGIYQNSRDALRYLKEERNLNGEFIYYGFSFGSIFAFELAAEVEQPAAVIVEAAPASTDAAIRANLRMGIPASFFFNETFDSTRVVGGIEAPILFFHGDQDETVSYENNVGVLFNAAPEPKRLITVEGAGHSTIISTLTDEGYLDLIEDFLSDEADL